MEQSPGTATRRKSLGVDCGSGHIRRTMSAQIPVKGVRAGASNSINVTEIGAEVAQTTKRTRPSNGAKQSASGQRGGLANDIGLLWSISK